MAIPYPTSRRVSYSTPRRKLFIFLFVFLRRTCRFTRNRQTALENLKKKKTGNTMCKKKAHRRLPVRPIEETTYSRFSTYTMDTSIIRYLSCLIAPRDIRATVKTEGKHKFPPFCTRCSSTGRPAALYSNPFTTDGSASTKKKSRYRERSFFFSYPCVTEKKK